MTNVDGCEPPLDIPDKTGLITGVKNEGISAIILSYGNEECWFCE